MESPQTLSDYLMGLFPQSLKCVGLMFTGDYGGEATWVAEQEDALDFTRVEEAYQACWRESFSDMVVALRTERPPCELKLPVPQDQMSWSHGVVE